MKDHAQDGQNGQTAPSATPEPGKPGAVEQAKQADATAKAGQKSSSKKHTLLNNLFINEVTNH